MTDKQEERRVITKSQWMNDIHHFEVWLMWKDYPLAPQHSDEEYAALEKELAMLKDPEEIWLRYKEPLEGKMDGAMDTIQRQKARIKELEEEKQASELALGTAESGEALKLATARIKELENWKPACYGYGPEAPCERNHHLLKECKGCPYRKSKPRQKRTKGDEIDV